MSALDDLLSQTEDEPIPGGCDRCEAYQTVESQTRGIYAVTVHHDDWCPNLRAKEAGAN